MQLHLILDDPKDRVNPITMADAIIQLVNSTMRSPHALEEITDHLEVHNRYSALNGLDSIGVPEP